MKIMFPAQKSTIFLALGELMTEREKKELVFFELNEKFFPDRQRIKKIEFLFINCQERPKNS